MSQTVACLHWRTYVAIAAAAMAAATAAAVVTHLWVLTAIPVGILFGFFLQKGDLCGASAFSEVVLMRDGKKVWGLWVCIVTGMAAFAVLDALGWVKLNPKPLTWLSYIVGGVLFGVGMVLAGGCVSGCLFKAGAGNLNSMAALPAIALGVALVEHGPLKAANAAMKTFVVETPEGGAVTLSSLTGLPFWSLALAFAVLTIGAAMALRLRRRPREARGGVGPRSWQHVLLARTWRPWQAGLAIGVLGGVAYLSSAATGRNYPLGVTHGVLHAHLLVTDSPLKHVWAKPARGTAKAPAPQSAAPAVPRKKVVWWLIGLVVSLAAGSWLSGRLSGEARLLPKPPEQTVVAFLGGLLVGAGAGLAKGCVVGNIMSGWALMSVGTVLFGIVVVLANWVTTYFYLMGGSLIPSDE